MNLVERFLKYVSFDTQSDELTRLTPSTPGQMVFAEYLKSELESLGLEDITLDENGYLFATLPANTEKELPVIGFIAHMDTSPDMSGKNVTPRIVEKYDGSDIVLCAEENIVLSPSQFPELLDHKGEDLIVTNGKTLLGADDKAGIAEIVSAVVYLQEHPEIKHGKIRIGFNPDEEIGEGAHKFDVQKFGCEWAYTMDGGEVGELEFENFNAAAAKITFKGRNVHPGYAKHKMINSIRIANQFITMLPRHETPEHTSGYEGFYHLIGIQGDVEQSTVSYIIRIKYSFNCKGFISPDQTVEGFICCFSGYICITFQSNFAVFFCQICCGYATDIHVITICTLIFYNNGCIFGICKFLCQCDCLLQFPVTDLSYDCFAFLCECIVRYKHFPEFFCVTACYQNTIDFIAQFFCCTLDDIILRNRCHRAVCTCYIHRIAVICGIWYHGVLISISFVI